MRRRWPRWRRRSSRSVPARNRCPCRPRRPTGGGLTAGGDAGDTLHVDRDQYFHRTSRVKRQGTGRIMPRQEEQSAMLSTEENTYLTRTGPGTPMGELFRRFWLPIFLSFGAPTTWMVRHCGPRLLNEDLVGYPRHQRPLSAFLGCLLPAPPRAAVLWPHRRVRPALSLPRLEVRLRRYVLDMPSEPPRAPSGAGENKAHPACEAGGFVWTYMGPPDKQPGGTAVDRVDGAAPERAAA